RLTVFADGLRDIDGRIDEDLRRALSARGVRTIDAPVVEVIGDGTGISEVITADGESHPIDAIFTGGRLVPHDGFLDGLELDRSPSPVGSFISVDGMQRTSHPRVWAAGNVVTPMATVPLSMGAGSIAGAAINFALVEQEFADALGE
ncbi:MAG: FAD-dependent oxidoreductase, partial [Actinobacteria bacterium]|nr:FAD-dependent oxidoreductase [Actinomycetota bacterium]